MITPMNRRLRNHAESGVTNITSLEELESGVTADFVAQFGGKPVPVTAEQAFSIVARLRVLFGEAIENAKRIDIELTPAKLIKLCDELINETRQPGHRPAYDESVEGFFLGGVFDELVQQPSNIFETLVDPQGREYYVPLSPENWRACLERLRSSLMPNG